MTAARLKQIKDLNSTQRWLFVTLCSYANKKGECWPSQVELAETTGLTRVTVNTHLKKLCQLGYIESQKRLNDKGDLDTCLYSIKIKPTPQKSKGKASQSKRSEQSTKEKLTDISWADGIIIDVAD